MNQITSQSTKDSNNSGWKEGDVSYGGTVPKTCLRVTWFICASGVILGFGLLFAGEIGRHHFDKLQTVMYIGILLFSVSLLLLVIFCSSYGIFTAKQIEQLRHPNLRVNREQNVKAIPHIPDPVKLPLTTENLPSRIATHGYKEQNISTMVPIHLAFQSGVAKRQELQNCVVKNCVCLTRHSQLENNKNTGFVAGGIPLLFDKVVAHSGCNHCHYASHFHPPAPSAFHGERNKAVPGNYLLTHSMGKNEAA